MLSKDKLLIHNGHDNDNEKLTDMWTFDLSNNSWTQIDQKGEIPPVSIYYQFHIFFIQGRNGHTLVLHRDFLIMFGGILEVTKESEDIYVYHIPSQTWKLIDMEESPQNLETFFKSNVESKLRASANK